MEYPIQKVLLVDDEEEILVGFEFTLNSRGITNTASTSDSSAVMPFLAENNVGVVLLDLSMPGKTGEELLKEIKSGYPHIKVIVITGLNRVETAVNCMKLGAFDYMVKPVEQQRLVSSVKRAIELQEQQNEYRSFRELVLKDELKHPQVFKEIVTQNKKMRSIFQYIEAIAPTNKPVLITGDSGVGKGLIANAIHTLSRLQGKFVSVNIAGLDDNIFTDTLYGHIKGAFTGAEKIRAGLVEQATQGSLFLDEIGELSPSSQVKLLRLLEEEEYLPIGSDIAKEAQVRVIAATNKSVNQLRESKFFRTDLYYRLQIHHIHLPALVDRLDDLPVLVNHFFEQAAKSLNKKKPTPPRELIALLSTYRFPGNIRELHSMVFDAVSHHQSKMLSMDRFREHMLKHGDLPEDEPAEVQEDETIYSSLDNLPTLKEARLQLIKEALNRSQENTAIAADMLGISRSGLNKVRQRDQED